MSPFEPYPKYPVAAPGETARLVHELVVAQQANPDQAAITVLIISVLGLLTIMAVAMYRKSLRRLFGGMGDGAL